jgi:anti-sigma factor RsiW
MTHADRVTHANGVIHAHGERMSLALDGRLSARERAELDAHLAVCDECRTRWAAFQQVDRVLSSAPQAAPAPGFVNRFAAKLAKQRALEAQRAKRERIIAGIGTFAAAPVALALLVVPLVLTALTGISRLVTGTPTLLANAVEMVARWWVTFRALGEAGQSIVGVLAPSSGPIVAGYALMLIVVIAAWVSMMRSASRRWNATTLPVLAWL